MYIDFGQRLPVHYLLNYLLYIDDGHPTFVPHWAPEHLEQNPVESQAHMEVPLWILLKSLPTPRRIQSISLLQ
jgi:hypothetical protein